MKPLHALPLTCVCNVRQGKVGLTSGENACYQNSVLQALFMVPGLVDYFLGTAAGCEGLDPVHGNIPVVASLGQLFKSMRSAAPGTVVSTSGSACHLTCSLALPDQCRAQLHACSSSSAGVGAQHGLIN